MEVGYKAYSMCVCVCVCSETRWFGLTSITPRNVAGGNVVTARAKDLRPNCLNSVESAGNERFLNGSKRSYVRLSAPLGRCFRFLSLGTQFSAIQSSNHEVEQFQPVRVYTRCCQAGDRVELAAVDGNEGHTDIYTLYVSNQHNCKICMAVI